MTAYGWTKLIRIWWKMEHIKKFIDFQMIKEYCSIVIKLFYLSLFPHTNTEIHIQWILFMYMQRICNAYYVYYKYKKKVNRFDSIIFIILLTKIDIINFLFCIFSTTKKWLISFSKSFFAFFYRRYQWLILKKKKQC